MQELNMMEVEEVSGALAPALAYLLIVGIGYAGAEMGWWNFSGGWFS